MNIACVIGVSKYLLPGNDLPACKNDARHIWEVLMASEKYAEVIYINDNQNSTETKSIITEFIGRMKGKSINEAFFYYSGHGEFYKDEFYYLLSDYESKKRNQTSLQNSEIDRLFKGLNPSLMIKVVDACQSGTAYIKSNDILDSYFKKTAQDSFKSCYFIYSSLNEQSSYANTNISYFTASFIGALKGHSSEAIRFKDVIDVIVDDFEGNSQQTPFFVLQGDLTEKFVVLNDRLRNLLSDASSAAEIDVEAVKPRTLAELVKNDAKKYANRERALATLSQVRDEIESLTLVNDLKGIYEISSSFSMEYSRTPEIETVATWLTDNQSEYFARPSYGEGYDQEFGVEYRYVAGFDLNMDVPYREIVIDVIGNYPNVTSYNCCVLFFLSKRSIRFFYSINRYFETNFDERRLVTKGSQWLTTVCDITDRAAVADRISEIKQKIEDIILVELRAQFSEDDLPF